MFGGRLNNDETITKDELAAYYRRQTYSAEWHTPESSAEAVFKDIKQHREPNYDDGAAYLDADGDVWMYDSPTTRDSEGTWYTLATSLAYRFDVPKRPLRLIK